MAIANGADAHRAGEAGSALKFRDVKLYCGSRFTGLLGQSMQNIAIGWFVYGLTHSAWSLGLTGLFTFLPVLLFSLVSGQVADMYDRRLVVAVSYSLTAIVATGLLVYNLVGWTAVWPVYVFAILIGTARSFGSPAARALLPNIVPRDYLGSAVAWGASVESLANTLGPALGGLLYMLGADVVFSLATVLYVCAAGAMISVRARSERQVVRKVTLETVGAGLKFIGGNKVLLGAISLDMMAVCLGGVGALLPIFSDRLHASSWGAGLLRTSQAGGALGMAYLLAHVPVRRKAGVKMLITVAIYGLGIVSFGLSRSIVTSVLALIAVGAADQISVFIRQTIISGDTPDAMRGRVSAVNVIFTGASGSLGEFESGSLAALVGAVPAVLIGGFGAVFCAVAWGIGFPELRRRDRLITSSPAQKPEPTVVVGIAADPDAPESLAERERMPGSASPASSA
jgi:hypothetical protein